MSLLTRIKDSYAKKQEEFQNNLDKVPLTLKAEYYGGYDRAQKSAGTLRIWQDKVQFNSLKSHFIIDRQNIKDIAVEGQDQVLQQRTITRNLLLAGKSKKVNVQDTYITVTTSDGQGATFHVEGRSHFELKPLISQKLVLVA